MQPCKRLWNPSRRVWFQKNDDSECTNCKSKLYPTDDKPHGLEDSETKWNRCRMCGNLEERDD